MFNIDEMVDNEEYELYKSNGDTIDSLFCCFVYTFKDMKRNLPFAFEFVSANIKYWTKFANDSDGIFFNVFSVNKIAAVFNPNEEYPFFRFYFLDSRITEKFSINLLIKQFKAKNFIESFANDLIKDRVSLTKNMNNWFTKMDEMFNPSTTMANGRMNNTTIDQTVIIHRQPKGCVACGEKGIGYISSILSGNKTVYFIANVCKEHQERAKTYPNFLNYILELFDAGEKLAPFQMKENVPTVALDLLFKKIAQELDAPEVINKRRYAKDIDQTTATFERKTGFTIIIRLRTLMKYGYIINDPNGKQFKRIDSADHHNDILDVGPDHIHHDPQKETKQQNIESSFTTGFPLFDLPAIKKILEDAEKM